MKLIEREIGELYIEPAVVLRALDKSICALRAAEIALFTSDANSAAGLTLACFRTELLRISQGLPLRADVIQRALSATEVVSR